MTDRSLASQASGSTNNTPLQLRSPEQCEQSGPTMTKFELGSMLDAIFQEPKKSAVWLYSSNGFTKENLGAQEKNVELI